MIAAMLKGGLEPNYFSPCNSPRATTCPFSKTMVLIAAHPRLHKAREPPVPAMKGEQ
jgi:hypothetical protein